MTETVQATPSTQIRVTNSTAARFDVNGTRVSSADGRTFTTDLSGVGPGIYTVTYSATSAVDGHFTAGSFAFAVQNADGSMPGSLPAPTVEPPPPPAPAQVALRFGSFLTLSLFAGAAALCALVWAPSALGLKGERRAAATDGLRLLLVWAGGNGLVYACLTTAWLASAIASSGGTTLSTFDASLAARAVIGGGGGAVLLIAGRRIGARLQGGRRDPLLIVGLLLGLCAAAAAGLASHAAAHPQWGPPGALIDAFHLSAASLWVGSLVTLLLAHRILSQESNARLAARVFRRFSRMALGLVTIVLLCGVLLSLIHVGTLDRLFGTTYGLLVAAKASLFVPMAVLGAHNHYRSVPALRIAEESAAALRRLARNIRAEAALGATVLLVAAILTATSPPTTSALGPPAYRLSDTVGGVRVDFEVDPTPSIPQVYTLQFTLWNASSGIGLVGAANGTLRFTLQNSTLPALEVALDGPHGNHYFATTPAMGQPGTWRIDGRVPLSDGMLVNFTFHLALGSG